MKENLSCEACERELVALIDGTLTPSVARVIEGHAASCASCGAVLRDYRRQSLRLRRMPLLMNACDALIFTSLQEGSPNAVKEALACNLPVVSVPVGDVAERLHGVAGCELCPDDRPETLAAALERVLKRGTRTASRETVAHLDERLIADRVIGVYMRAMQQHHTNGNGRRV